MNSIATIATHDDTQKEVHSARRIPVTEFEERRFQVYTDRQFDKIEGIKTLPEETRFEMKVVASVLPFRVNEYVINELIRWDRVPDDPVYQLVFPQRGMLREAHFEEMAELHRQGADRKTIQGAARKIREALNPHPAGQMEMNMPTVDGEILDGVQHKYRETVLFFPAQGQTCHSYCTFCFRWAQFVGDRDLKMASTEAEKLHAYLREHREVSDLLVTGGDPMVMKTKHLVQYLEPLLEPEFDHIRTIRIGTKALTFWPYRFVSDNDADELIDLLARLADGGKHLAIMAHYNHWQEITTDIAETAIARLRSAGAEIRAQGPLIKHVNDDPRAWAKLWQREVELGIIPYYMFVERDTGAKNYFELPLAEALEIYREAIKQISGLARTARGPSMSAGPGKVEIQGTAQIHGEKVFVLRFLQGRNPDWVQRPFFARFSETATWLHELEPAFGEKKFFFEEEYERMKLGNG
jgi:KamA family protein